MKRALIFLHGNLTDATHVKEYFSDSFIICADGGVEHALSLGITPQVVIGDFDSVSGDHRVFLESNHVVLKTYPREKDFTDGELAVQYAIDHNYPEIIITGLLGDRLDHLTANLMFLTSLSRDHNISIVEHDQKVYFVHDSITIQGKSADEVSLIPLQKKCTGISTSGLQYGLHDASLPIGSTRGISNVMTENSASISVLEGVLMVVHRQVRSRE